MTYEALLEKLSAENREAEAKRPAPTAEEVAKEAAFLKRWSKGKPIIRESSDGTFWSKGKLMTKIDFKMAEALAAGGYATLSGDAKSRGAKLVIKK